MECAAGALRYPLSVGTGGSIYVQMRWLRDHPPFDDETKRQELCRKLNEIPGVTVTPERMTDFPRVLLKTLTDDASSLRAFLDTMTWVVSELQSATT